MNEVWEKVYKAYTFSFPLMIMDATVRVSTNTVEPGDTGKAPANRWMHAKELASAAFRQVVTPNVDTIYSQIFIDLGLRSPTWRRWWRARGRLPSVHGRTS